MKFLLLLAIIVLAPHTKVPGHEFIYPFRPSDLIIVVAAVAGIPWIASTLRSRRGVGIALAMSLFFILAIASAFWGYIFLSSENLEAMVIDGERVDYLTFAIKKLFLLAICFYGFRYVANDESVSGATLLKFWYRGLTIAVALHLLLYILSPDYFVQRAGVFVEGNHGGSYYLLSFFLMWIAVQEGLKFGRYGMGIAFLGIMLSQSTTSLLLLLFLSIVAYFLLPPKPEVGKRRLGPVLVGVGIAIVIAAVYGDTVVGKLTGEGIDSNTFSRYDRIASILSGANMFLAHPLFGVGIQGYAFALPKYVDPFIETFFDWNSRRIANNIYVEIMAEQGFIGFVSFCFLIYRIGAPAFRQIRHHSVACAALASIFFSWLAFPTYTISFHWIGMAVIYRLTAYGRVGKYVPHMQLNDNPDSRNVMPNQFT
jgi:O-antigen ligase